MATKNSDYWDSRSEQLEAVLNAKARSAYKELEKIFNAAIKAADKELAKWYTRFMMNEDVSLAEAKKLLKAKELEEFRWTVEEYIEKGRANGISQDWGRQLENASARVHISRLEAIKLQLQNIIEQIYGQHLTIADNLMRDIYSESYYRNAFEVFREIGIGWTFASFDENHLEKILNKPWAPDSFNFSKRIWNNKAKLVANVHKALTQNLILGSDPQKSIDDIANKMNTSKYNAGRLIMTESAFFSGEARKDCFSSLGVEQYRIVATLDMRTSEICRDMDGKVFKMSEYDPGMTAPPFHPYCRTTTAPYFADMDAFAERAARDPETGKTYHVPANMTYNEWYEKHVALRDKQSGAASGAWNDQNDPDHQKRDRVAKDLYTQIRNHNRGAEIKAVAKNSGLSVEDVTRAYDHIFIREHNLGNRIGRFDPDYYMAHSWNRIRHNDHIQPHDLIMLKHEIAEEKIMGESLDILYEEAHKQAEKMYNYGKALKAYLKDHDV